MRKKEDARLEEVSRAVAASASPMSTCQDACGIATRQQEMRLKEVCTFRPAINQKPHGRIFRSSAVVSGNLPGAARILQRPRGV